MIDYIDMSTWWYHCRSSWWLCPGPWHCKTDPSGHQLTDQASSPYPDSGRSIYLLCSLPPLLLLSSPLLFSEVWWWSSVSADGFDQFEWDLLCCLKLSVWHSATTNININIYISYGFTWSPSQLSTATVTVQCATETNRQKEDREDREDWGRHARNEIFSSSKNLW